MATTPSLETTTFKRLEGKVALITGGASGIGEATARLFSKHGAKVVIADVQDNLGNAVCKDLETPSFYVHCDVTKEEDVENAVNTTVFMFGKLDIMFNNAGIIGVNKTNILEIQKHEFDQIMNVNVTGPFLGTKHAARVMIPVRRGSIINTASMCGVIGGVASHAYTASKHAVVGLTKNTAVELGQFGIRVNSLGPAVVASTPLAKNFFKFDKPEGLKVYNNLKGVDLEPSDVADAALYLGSDDSKFVSGINLLIDGGFTVVNAGFSVFGNSD